MDTQSLKTYLRKLQQKKYRDEYGVFVVEGKKGVEEALASAEVECIVIEKDSQNFPELLDVTKKNNILVRELSAKDVAAIQDTETFPGILAVIKKSEIHTEATSPILVLDGIRDPGNLGTIIRTADWFGIKQIILSEDCVDLYNPKVVRSTMGSLFHLYIQEVKDVVQYIKEKKFGGSNILGLIMNGESIEHMQCSSDDMLVVGSESHGVRPEIVKLLDRGYTISGYGKAESLNAGIATGIALYQITRN